MKKELSLKQRDELLTALKDRFEKNLGRHPGLVWAKVQARLVAEGEAKPGASVWIALEEVIRPSWHTYWINPGDAGLATTIDWTLPPGFTTRFISATPFAGSGTKNSTSAIAAASMLLSA